jgi:zinc finger RNA-binding protein
LKKLEKISQNTNFKQKINEEAQTSSFSFNFKLNDEPIVTSSTTFLLDNEKSKIQINNENFEMNLQSFNKRYLLFKHEKLYPSNEQLELIQIIITDIEKALKIISDKLCDELKNTKNIVKLEPTNDNNDNFRVLQGVMRVGFIAKGLLLKSDKSLHLVMLCLTKPTVDLLERVSNELKYVLINYKIDINISNACLYIQKNYYNVQLSFTSSEFLNDLNSSNSNELPKQKCLEYLSEIKRTQWFQENLLPISNSLLILRILRDFCQHKPEWSVLNVWTLEVVVKKCFLNNPYEPIGYKFRNIIESIASGILLSHHADVNTYLLDPCENNCDKIINDYLTVQQSESITASAQYMLRLIVFKQIYKVLDIDEIVYPPSKPSVDDNKINRS